MSTPRPTGPASTWGTGCRGKQPYRTRRRAEIERKLIVRRGRLDHPDTLESYHCPACGQWHLGNRRDAKTSQRRPVIQVRAADGDVVEVTWRLADGSERVVRYTQ